MLLRVIKHIIYRAHRNICISSGIPSSLLAVTLLHSYIIPQLLLQWAVIKERTNWCNVFLYGPHYISQRESEMIHFAHMLQASAKDHWLLWAHGQAHRPLTVFSNTQSPCKHSWAQAIWNHSSPSPSIFLLSDLHSLCDMFIHCLSSSSRHCFIFVMGNLEK